MKRRPYLQTCEILIRVQGREVCVADPNAVDVEAPHLLHVDVCTGVHSTADALGANLQFVNRDEHLPALVWLLLVSGAEENDGKGAKE